MKFLHIADVHLGAVPDSNLPWGMEREKEIWNSFYHIIDICNEEQVEFLLIAGDLFHKHPLIRELKEVNYAFQRLKNTQVVIMAGNHDFLSARSNYHGFEWDSKVHMFMKDTMEVIDFVKLDTKVYGLSYLERDITEALYDEVKPGRNTSYCHILLAHGGDEKDIPINRKKLQDSGFDYIALGHIHKPELISSKVAYSGSLEPLDKNETGEHGYIIGEIKKDSQGNRSTSIRFIPSSVRQYQRITLTINQTATNGSLLDQAKEVIKSWGTQHIYSFTLQGFRDESIHFDKEALKSLGNVIDVEDNSVPDYDFDLLSRDNCDNILGLFVQRLKGMQKQNEKDFKEIDKEVDEDADQEELINKALYYGVEALLNPEK